MLLGHVCKFVLLSSFGGMSVDPLKALNKPEWLKAKNATSASLDTFDKPGLGFTGESD